MPIADKYKSAARKVKNLKYRHDDAYRINALKNISEWNRVNSKYKIYRQLTNIRKQIVDRRNSITSMMNRLRSAEKRLIRMCARKTELEARWKHYRITVLGRKR